MRILVLTKPVPDPAADAERLGPDFRLDRAASPTVVNGNDEYALEAALQLVEAHGGEVAILSRWRPPTRTETMRKALAMGAIRGVLVTDAALAGRRPADHDPRARRGRRGAGRSTCCSPASTPLTAQGGAVAARRRRATRPAAAVGGRRASSRIPRPAASASGA